MYVVGEKTKDELRAVCIPSARTHVLLLGLMESKPGTESEYAERLMKMVGGFKTTFFVLNAEEFPGHSV